MIAPGRLRSLFPPANYGAVLPGAVYRSSYPEPKNYEFLQSLKLKTIM
jgi:tyrosine-protein phosphatase SIW14